jgi:hypothetical protein
MARTGPDQTLRWLRREEARGVGSVASRFSKGRSLADNRLNSRDEKEGGEFSFVPVSFLIRPPDSGL